MNDYLQPDFYRFSQDSLELVRHIQKKVLRADSILDLGAGCGVIGIELSKTLKPARLSLLELQEEYRKFLAKNVEAFLPKEVRSEIITESFASWKSNEQFELIVCNPPYYLPGRGQEASDPRKARARSFLLDGWKDLLRLTERSLLPDGRAFFVVKNDKNILKEVMDALAASKLLHEIEDQKNILIVTGYKSKSSSL